MDNDAVGPCFSRNAFIIFGVWCTGYLEALTLCSRRQMVLNGSLKI